MRRNLHYKFLGEKGQEGNTDRANVLAKPLVRERQFKAVPARV